jgi:hypothetical protein
VLLTVTLSQHVQESIEKHEWQINEQHDESSVDVSKVNSELASSVPAAAARRAAQQWREISCREDHNRLSTGTMAQSDVSARSCAFELGSRKGASIAHRVMFAS